MRYGRAQRIGSSYIAAIADISSNAWEGGGTSNGVATIAGSLSVRVPVVRFGSGTAVGTATVTGSLTQALRSPGSTAAGMATIAGSLSILLKGSGQADGRMDLAFANLTGFTPAALTILRHTNAGVLSN